MAVERNGGEFIPPFPVMLEFEMRGSTLSFNGTGEWVLLRALSVAVDSGEETSTIGVKSFPIFPDSGDDSMSTTLDVAVDLALSAMILPSEALAQSSNPVVVVGFAGDEATGTGLAKET